MIPEKKIILAICGASGVLYGVRLLRHLLNLDIHVHLIVSGSGKKVLAHEMNFDGDDLKGFLISTGIDRKKFDANVSVTDEHDFFSKPASGSFLHDGMVIAPCTMGTLGALASGISGNMVHRAADVCLKEKRPLIIVARETPLNRIHLENMLKLSDAGAVIMPASPSFYSSPASIEDLVDTIIARILNHLNIDHQIIPQWGD